MIKQSTDYPKPKILVAATGSVATIKLNELISGLLPYFSVKVIITERSKQFANFEELQQLKIEHNVGIFQDEDEISGWSKRGDPVLHIELRKQADLFLIAPLSANTLAKVANGICDNLVTLVARCWDMRLENADSLEPPSAQKQVVTKVLSGRLVRPMIVCPAMNNLMYDHPITEQQLKKLKNWGVTIVEPVEKVLICGEKGKGAMAKIPDIIEVARSQYQRSSNILTKERNNLYNDMIHF